MIVETSRTNWDVLKAEMAGDVLMAGDGGWAEAVATFNVALQHQPDVVVAAESTADVQAAVRAAAAAGMPVGVLGVGHGEVPVAGGMLISTKRMRHVTVDPVAQTATFGAGVPWMEVVAQAALHGLAPVTGSSPTVGAVGYLTGGGIGPLVRSHGASSDYVVSATVVTGAGDVVLAGPGEHADLLWAIRGGKTGLGVITEMTVRLVAVPSLYAGSLFFAEEHIEQVFRFWQQWTETAHPDVTTSVAIANFPPVEFLPEPLRGRRVLMLRFAYVGTVEEGTRLAEPLRGAAPVYIDGVYPMPLTETARIHNDPPAPMPFWLRGLMLNGIDYAFCTEILNEAGAGTNSPFLVVEIRHIDGKLRTDVPEGSAVGGRNAKYSLNMIAANPAVFAQAPQAADEIMRRIGPWINDEWNINFAGIVRDPSDLDTCWPAPIRERLAVVRAKYDPAGVFAG